MQVIVPFQDGATVATDSIARVIAADKGTVSRRAYETLQREKAALEHRVAALATRAAELKKEVDLLAATRLWDVDGHRLGARGRLIPARVITEDLLPWRSSRLVTVGTLQGIRRGSAVTSRVFTIDEGDAGGLRGGMAVVLGEAFIGLVEQVGTHVSRVKLLSDVSVQMKVRVGRFTDDGFVSLDKYFWLTGRGNGVMEIRDAQRRDVETGLIQVGDTVLSDPTSDMLPAAMTIGRITAIEPDRDNPLLSIVTVNSVIEERSLRRIYVYDTNAEIGGSVKTSSP
jgi:cell shape-determining protein MreC